jgi:hypothetical protein
MCVYKLSVRRNEILAALAEERDAAMCALTIAMHKLFDKHNDVTTRRETRCVSEVLVAYELVDLQGRRWLQRLVRLAINRRGGEAHDD